MKNFLIVLFLIIGCNSSHRITTGPIIPTPADFRAEQLTCGILFSWSAPSSTDTMWWFNVQYKHVPNGQWVSLSIDSLHTTVEFLSSNNDWSVLLGQMHEFRVICTDGYYNSNSNSDSANVKCDLP